MPNAINEVKIEGNLTRDAESKYTNSGKLIVSLSLAYNSSYKKGDEWVKEVSYFDITVWGNEEAGKLNKGDKVYIEGKLKQDRWERDGKTQSRVSIVAFKIEPRPRQAGQGEARNPAPVPPREPAHADTPTGQDDFTDDIPF